MAPDAAIAGDAATAPVVDMGELAPTPTARRIVALRPDGAALELTWDDGRVSRFHHIWLRDNCACPACRHPQTRERLFEVLDLPDDMPAPRAELRDDGALRLAWPEAGGVHESLFDPGWLRARDDGNGPGPTARGRASTWDANMRDRVPTLAYGEVMRDDAGLRRWLDALGEYALAQVTEGPTRDTALLDLVQRVGWARETNFGRTFDVVSKPNPNNAAYTAIKLEPHVDLPNWRRPPDFQLLYCLENDAEGGASTLVDGFAVAEALRAEDPAAFEVLATQPVDFRFQDEDSDIHHRAPVIGRDGDGALCEIRFNNWIRDAVNLPADKVVPWYRAYRRFWRLLRDPRFMIRFTLRPGQMIAFDNLRVLHGRDAFDPGSGRRRLKGCYIDRDLVMSRLRVLERAAV